MDAKHERVKTKHLHAVSQRIDKLLMTVHIFGAIDLPCCDKYYSLHPLVRQLKRVQSSIYKSKLNPVNARKKTSRKWLHYFFRHLNFDLE